MKTKMLLFLLLLFTNASNYAQQFVNGNFSQSVIASSKPTDLANCPSSTVGWRMGSYNGRANPQITDYSQPGNTYIDLTPCGSNGSGSWIEQEIDFPEACTFSVSLKVKPMNGTGNVKFWPTIDGQKIGNSVITVSNQTSWNPITTANFTVAAGKHKFQLSTSGGSSDNQFNVIGIDDFVLNKIGNCSSSDQVICDCPAQNDPVKKWVQLQNITTGSDQGIEKITEDNIITKHGIQSYKIMPVYACFPRGRSESDYAVCDKNAEFKIVLFNPDGTKSMLNANNPIFKTTVMGVYKIQVVPFCGNQQCTSFYVKFEVKP